MDDAPAIRAVDDILAHGLRWKASDIHIEPTVNGVRVRYRLDGFLQEHLAVLAEYATHVVARIKVLARLDIAEKRIPQDGKFVVATQDQGDIDLRVATFPCLHGEKVVIRLLGDLRRLHSLDAIGFDPFLREQIDTVMQRAHGFFIVTGPTGAGKTTTLYALLGLFGASHKNVVTLEDPVEYTIAGTTQGQINPDIGFDFAQGIRALLRQDPDVIMVGEMRDDETAQTAVQAALTGHFVLSTLHTNDAPGAIIRLLDMHIKAFLINATITGILAQRLVRILCTQCKYKTTLTAEEQEYVDLVHMRCEQAFRADGCLACSGTGYQGRIGIFELLLMTPQIRAVIHDTTKYDELHAAVRAQGMRPLIVDGMQKVAAGVTSVSELMRTIHP